MTELYRNPNPGHSLDSTVFETIEGKHVGVDMTTWSGPDLKSETPSIGLLIDGRVVAELTWDEVRQLAEDLMHITDVAEFG